VELVERGAQGVLVAPCRGRAFHHSQQGVDGLGELVGAALGVGGAAVGDRDPALDLVEGVLELLAQHVELVLEVVDRARVGSGTRGDEAASPRRAGDGRRCLLEGLDESVQPLTERVRERRLGVGCPRLLSRRPRPEGGQRIRRS
jgi:hypothetical protein